jgi:hypothetical protein
LSAENLLYPAILLSITYFGIVLCFYVHPSGLSVSLRFCVVNGFYDYDYLIAKGAEAVVQENRSICFGAVSRIGTALREQTYNCPKSLRGVVFRKANDLILPVSGASHPMTCSGFLLATFNQPTVTQRLMQTSLGPGISAAPFAQRQLKLQSVV